MPVRALHHYTLGCAPSDLEPLREFYTKHIGLTVGARPPLPMAGYWLYAGDEPIVHLYATGVTSIPWDGLPATGPLDHISFRAHGLDQTREHLRANGIPFDEAPVPEWPLHQVFLRDPKGIKIELTFWLEAETRDASGTSSGSTRG